MFQHQRVFTREGWILTRSATPWDARAHQGKIGFSLPRRRLPLHFDDAKAAPRKGKSSRLKALGCCTSRQNSGVFGGKAKNRAHAKKEPKKHTVMTLVERDGKSRSFHIANVKAKTLREKIVTTVSRKSHLMTDELASRQGIRQPRHGEPQRRRICAPRRLHSCQHGRMSF